MELKVSVSEAIALIKEVENVPAKILEFIGMNIQKEVGAFLTNLMEQELTHHAGREKYERKEGETDYRNGSYTRTFCIKGVGDVELRVPGTGTATSNSRYFPGLNATISGLLKTLPPCECPLAAFRFFFVEHYTEPFSLGDIEARQGVVGRVFKEIYEPCRFGEECR